MKVDWTVIIYTLFLIDSMGAVVMSWFGQKWWMSTAGKLAKYFPPAKGWSMIYFLLVLAIGYFLGYF